MKTDKFYTLGALARYLGIERETLRNYQKRGRLVGRLVDGRRVFSLDDAEQAGVRCPYRRGA
jgi:DNA-binding transcriptional MerR regulator